MNSAPLLTEQDRQRMLQVMGYDIWVRRSSEPLTRAAAATKPRERTERVSTPVVARRSDGEARNPSYRSAPAAPVEATIKSAEPARPRRVISSAPQPVLLVLAARVQADEPFVQQLMKVFPGCMVCTPDSIGRGLARYAVLLGVDAALPVGVLGIKTLGLDGLRKSASARRALWWAIKPILKAKQD